MVPGSPIKRLGGGRGQCGWPQAGDRRARCQKSLAKADFPQSPEMVNFEDTAACRGPPNKNGQGMPPTDIQRQLWPLKARPTRVFGPFAKS
jgi:hypothetical protein